MQNFRWGDQKIMYCRESVNIFRSFPCESIDPLDKNPGLRPIGVGEVLRSIAAKVIFSHLKEDVIQSVGSLQVCAGQDAGCESLMHVM